MFLVVLLFLGSQTCSRQSSYMLGLILERRKEFPSGLFSLTRVLVHQQKARKEMDKQRDALADALYKKGLALIQLEEDQETPQVFHLRNEMLCNLFFSHEM